MQFLLELTDAFSGPVTAEVTVRRETVELRCRGKLAGIAGRDRLRAWLRAWLRAPFGVYTYDNMTWIQVDSGTLLYAGEVTSAHVLDEHALADLRSAL